MTKRGRKSLKFKLGFLNYLHLIQSSLLDPVFYSKQLPYFKVTNPEKIGALNALIFFLINSELGLLLNLLYLLITNKATLWILGLSQTLVFLPMFLLQYLGLGLLLHLVAKLLNGQGSLKQDQIALFYSSSPFLFIWLPYLRYPALGIFLILLIINFYRNHKYSKIKASVNILTPALILALFFLILLHP